MSVTESNNVYKTLQLTQEEVIGLRMALRREERIITEQIRVEENKTVADVLRAERAEILCILSKVNA